MEKRMINQTKKRIKKTNQEVWKKRVDDGRGEGRTMKQGEDQKEIMNRGSLVEGWRPSKTRARQSSLESKIGWE